MGGGIVGLACAWRAAQRGLSVVVLERDRVGSGASGVAAGMLAPVTEANFGEERLLALNLAGRERWPSFTAELGEELYYRDSGALAVAAERDDVEGMRRLHQLQRSLGLESDWLSPRECRLLEPALSPRVAGGILAPADGHVDPRAVMDALRKWVGDVREGVEVGGVETDGDRVTGVRAGGEHFAAGTVVIAAGAWSGRLEQRGGPTVRPVKGQLLRLRVRRGPDPIGRIVRTPRCYLLARGDGRVVLGATVEEQGFDTSVTAGAVAELIEAAREALPDVAELELVGAQAGLRPGTHDNLPAIKSGELDGLIWATGHYRNGVLLAPITADAVVALVAGEPPPPEVAALAHREVVH